MDKPVLPYPLWQRLIIFIIVLAVVIVIGAVWGASPEQRRQMSKQFARFAGF